MLSQQSATLLLFALVSGLIFGSLAVWSWVLLRLRSGQTVLEYAPRPEVHWSPVVLGVSFGWMLLDRLLRLVQLVARQWNAVDAAPPAPPELTLTMVQLNVFISLMIATLILAALVWQSPRRSLVDYGITFERFDSQADIGFRSALASFVPVATTAFITSRFRTPDNEHSLFRLLRADASPVTATWVAVAAVVAAPLLEELIFRVVLQGWLSRRLQPEQSIGLTATLFAAIHGWPDMLPLLPLAVLLGYVYHRTHRFFVVVILHGLFNGTNLAIALLSEVVQAAP